MGEHVFKTTDLTAKTERTPRTHKEAALELAAYESGVSVTRDIQGLNITILDAERTNFDPRLIEMYQILKKEHDEAIAASQKPKFSNGMQTSVVDYSLSENGELHLTIAPTPYLYVVAFQRLISEGKISLDEREAVSPNMLGTGLYAEASDGIRTSTWCQIKGQVGGVDVMGAGQAHSAFVGGSVGANGLSGSDPIKQARNQEALEEIGIDLANKEISSAYMIVKEIETGNFNVYQTVQDIGVEQIVSAFQKRLDAHIRSGAEGDPEVTAVVLVPNDTPLIPAGDRKYKIQPSLIIGIEGSTVVVREPLPDELMLGRPHTIGYLACTQLQEAQSHS